jgi:hypothetical protein
LFFDDDHLDKLITEGSLEIDLEKYITTRWNDILGELAQDYKDIIPRVLAADSSRFTETNVTINIPPPLPVSDADFEHSERVKSEKPLLLFARKAHSNLLKITLFPGWKEHLPAFALREMIGGVVQDILLGESFANVFMASTERTGAAIFKNELNFTRTRLIEAMTQANNASLKPQDILEAVMPFNSKYALPVRDEVDFANQLENIQKEESELLKKHPDILDDFNDILGGEYKVVKGAVLFAPNNTRGVRLGLGETSSAVRSLLDVGFYLRHRARIGDLFMIDEPELNLHPANQRKIARLLARLVNVGLRVFITTHSDYIAKELNTLILLNNAAPGFAEQQGYKHDEILDGKRVRLYIAGEGKRKKTPDASRATPCQTLCPIVPLEEGGFEYESFDETIHEMNWTQSLVWDHIMENRPKTQ